MKIRTLLALALLLMPSLMFALQKQERLYVYGVATSFNDSTVYITEIQQLDSAWVDTKTGFLYSRNNYSFQLRDHLKANGFATPTCVTYFAKTRKEIEKKYVALKKRYATRVTVVRAFQEGRLKRRFSFYAARGRHAASRG